jgi:flagellar biosynthesis protein FlhB
MKATDLFLIILKIFGIYLIKDVLISIPPVLYTIVRATDVSLEFSYFELVLSLLTLGIYTGICYLLLFQGKWIISKLNLTSGLTDEPLTMNLHRSSVYTIAIIVSGIVILVFAVPQLVRTIYQWAQYMDLSRSTMNDDYYNYEKMVLSFVEVLIGLLFLGNQRLIVNFIESRRREATGEAMSNEK